ncbi:MULTISPECIES: HIRAN domain-containing protein [unclassified Microbacterium]|uniref:HIRAN domain-containing protein n=1 Tax=unclassified Microbacterium TaxID=2609290 RepID=UPI00214C92B7|nr:MULTISPECIES: HIRAN domain-containing protein [unclassified Microbacterium]MCR2785064.1 HIRAN domain-containing protein [Microbacterium sp. zg.B96]MDL5352433.1 HIRAN domain-containing protein [Microbacterium sp. zg-YB36]WIM16599.1 HIRAN domain-containing protein [Microbacterium sp. zg-B96]
MPLWWEHLRNLLSLRAHEHATLPDLRGLETVRARVEGTHYLAHDRERSHDGDRMYVLRREPRNKRDMSAIAVYARGRAVGYVSATRAAAIAPLLDRLGGAAVINGLGSESGSSRLWVDLPEEEALLGFVRSYEGDAISDAAAPPR